MEVKSKEESYEELAARYKIDLKRLEAEQLKLGKQIELTDSLDFSKITRIGGCYNIFSGNKIISAIVVLNQDMEVIEQKYVSEKLRFPYIPGFRAYRELPAMLSCFDQIEDKPEVMFIPGHGISHNRLGIASHFSIVTGVPTIGIADSLIAGEQKETKIILNKKIVAEVVQIKEGSRPVYISPGNLITLNSAVELAKKLVKEPHKLPEPLRLAHKYAREVMKEVSNQI